MAEFEGAADLKASTKLVAAERSLGDFVRPDAADGACGAVVEMAIGDLRREIARTEPLHGVGADMPALEPAGSRAIVARESRPRATGGDAQQKIGIEQLIAPRAAA